MRDLYCYLCDLQFDGKIVYDKHQSIVHNYQNGKILVQKAIKAEFEGDKPEFTVSISKSNSNLGKYISCSSNYVVNPCRYCT